MDNNFKRKLFQMVEVGYTETGISRLYDVIHAIFIITNLCVCILFTYNRIYENFYSILSPIETSTGIFFLLDYIFRLFTADLLYPKVSKPKALLKYIFSFRGIIDFLSILPLFSIALFPSGIVTFRMLRIVRIFKLFRINAYNDSINLIAVVISRKKQQLLSSLFIVGLLMIASSLCMYSLEHNAQPEIFSNAFSGMWWSVSTLLTVGYGDIYPITTAGKAFGIIISILGVGMVAIPTGIISAGFVEEYSRLKEETDNTNQCNYQFSNLKMSSGDLWAGKTVSEIPIPDNMKIAMIQRDDLALLPKEDMTILKNDLILFCPVNASI